ncbi:DUF192 domain-containing protein [Paracoccus zeaxanthinifaciens]|uniref:DUF192 domain-containing protein n=1 Tax=Paracoccus zeaxanthinifaciens TaxID=187400 RepID=UPI0003B3E678|nr:DUF192 domain-containing protein [Paracoccus zeaxanthinifaciens]
MWPSKAAALLAVLMPAAAAAVECAPGSLVVDTGAETLGFRVEVADSPEERAQGLMFRKELPAGTGMLFIYESPQPVSFWMRNTLIPLDMVFADETGVIRHIHRNARPLDETPIPGAAVGDPDPDRLFVLEIAGGEADRLGLKPGQPMAHPGMGDNAVLACD